MRVGGGDRAWKDGLDAQERELINSQKDQPVITGTTHSEQVRWPEWSPLVHLVSGEGEAIVDFCSYLLCQVCTFYLCESILHK